MDEIGCSRRPCCSRVVQTRGGRHRNTVPDAPDGSPAPLWPRRPRRPRYASFATQPPSRRDASDGSLRRREAGDDLGPRGAACGAYRPCVARRPPAVSVSYFLTKYEVSRCCATRNAAAL
ncbi:hypothetical protein PAHAL_3G335400 [Panicum hallii]|uniref:Uncharacterized protein n=1 Tax=Panicum hallii TaxID=206008 RepID=A0A2S3HDH1_9POAL|nr:hypothetical protein PAHAL_3G335400 [Panicum hallii]